MVAATTSPCAEQQPYRHHAPFPFGKTECNFYAVSQLVVARIKTNPRLLMPTYYIVF